MEYKICVVTTISLTIKTFLLDQLVFLSRRGLKVTVICDYDPEFEKICPEEIEYIPVRMTRSIGPFSTFLGLLKLFYLFRKRKFDIVQYSTPKAALLSSVAAFFARIPVRLYCQWGIRYVGFSGLARGVFKLTERLTCLCSTDIAPDSRGNLQFSIAEGLYPPEKGAVVHYGSANGVNLNKFDISRKQLWRDKVRTELKIENYIFVYGFVGRITRDKGINELISAFLKILEKDKDIVLLLVGPEEEKHGLSEETVKVLESNHRIIAVGPKSNPEQYIAAMDVMVLPSYREGFGIVAIEAQAIGVPVISTEIPGPSEAVINGETGFLVPVGEIEPLVRAMQALRQDNVLLNSMASKGYRYASEGFEQGVFWQKVYEHRMKLVNKRAKR